MIYRADALPFRTARLGLMSLLIFNSSISSTVGFQVTRGLQKKFLSKQSGQSFSFFTSYLEKTKECRFIQVNKKCSSNPNHSSISLDLHNIDFMDIDNSGTIYGEKYSMVELPDSLMDTTIFVGNLNDFVTDDILSDLFQQVSTLNSVPSVVARKPNSNSLNYGFVTFPSVEEKEVCP